MAPKTEEGGPKQPTLFSFFSKPKTSPASSLPPSSSLATPPLTAKKSNASASTAATTASSSNSKPAQAPAKPKPISSSNAVINTPAPAAKKKQQINVASSLTPPITSESDIMDIDDDDHRPQAPSSSTSIPVKRAAITTATSDEDDEEDDEDRVQPQRKRLAASNRAIILDSDSDDDPVVSKKKPSTSGKKKKSSKDDDDFAANDSDAPSSVDYFDDDLDDFIIADDSLGSSKPKSKPKSAPAKKATQTTLTRPGAKPVAGGSGSGTGKIMTQAELARQKEKDKKVQNEEVFEFLVDIKDADGIRPGEEGYDPRTLFIPKKAWSKFTPFETQFWEIKKDHFDTVLFFQKGKFFELYEEDASIGHREFDLKLTDRVKMRMVGVPESHFDFWAAKFLAQGYKVGRVDQCETALGAEMRVKDGKAKGKSGGTASNGKAIVRRELKSVLTSGTIVDGSMLTDDLSNHCVAVKEEISSPTSPPIFGVCVLDASTAGFSFSYFEDDISRTQLETLIRQLKPKELIHQKGNLSVSTLRTLRNSMSLECQWTAIKAGTEFLSEDETKQELRKYFSGKGRKGSHDDEDEDEEMEEDGNEDARIPEKLKVLFDKPVTMSALGAMIWYLRQLNLDWDLITANNYSIFDPLSDLKALILDGQTLAHIEVLQNSQGGQDGTLFQLLQRCVTPFGKRLFKIWLCAPLRHAGAINARLDAVEDLLANPNVGTIFDKMARKLPDLERLVSRIHAKSCKKPEFLKVVASFELISNGIKNLCSATEDFKSDVISNLLSSAPDLSELLEKIQEMYEGEELLPVEGKDEAFEDVKSKVEEIENELQELLERAKKSLKCNSLSFKDIGTKEIYQIQVPVKVKVPGNWTRMSNTKEFNRYYSPELEQRIQELKEARERKQAVLNDFQFTVFSEFAKDNETWLKAVAVVAELDCLVSLSKSSAALGEPCVRPEIIQSDTAFVEFEELRHPCVFSASTDFIPNDVSLGGNTENMVLLTGPNMAGKSTMLRMTCTAIIMAQIGCFVPASKARISPIDAIYSRMGANDFIFANASTFKVEMDDTNKILRKATPKSLVILDELGRGTSTYDGMAIAFAVLHRLATHVGCIGFFATHFTSLTEDFSYHPQIRLCQMATQVDDETKAVTFLYRLILGASPKSYGPHVARMAGLSGALVDRAINISKEFEGTSRAHERAMRANESLPLTSQADAAFLIQFAKMGLAGLGEGMDAGQLLRTLKIIRSSVDSMKAGKSPETATVE
ncbi:DNA mismatch repair protein Msh6 [Meredithblackwellia eburnea MCA 4105]